MWLQQFDFQVASFKTRRVEYRQGQNTNKMRQGLSYRLVNIQAHKKQRVTARTKMARPHKLTKQSYNENRKV